jgi:fructokinase
VTGISTDDRGRRLLDVLRESGVDTGFVARTGEPTTVSMVTIDRAGVPGYEFSGESERQIAPLAVADIPGSVHTIHLGSYALVVEPSASTLRALVEREQGHRLLSWDPNVRLSIAPDWTSWRELTRWMSTRVDLVKASDEDVAILAPGQAPLAFASSLLARGVALVVVTLGSRGSAAFCRAGVVEVPAMPVEVVDTVGAGDTFQAAMLCRLAEHGVRGRSDLERLSANQVEEVLSFANAAAGLNCTRRGASPPGRLELPA